MLKSVMKQLLEQYHPGHLAHLLAHASILRGGCDLWHDWGKRASNGTPFPKLDNDWNICIHLGLEQYCSEHADGDSDPLECQHIRCHCIRYVPGSAGACTVSDYGLGTDSGMDRGRVADRFVRSRSPFSQNSFSGAIAIRVDCGLSANGP